MKHLVFATAQVLEELDAPTDEARSRRIAVKSAARVYDVMDSSPMTMPEAAPRDLQEETEEAMMASIWLGNATSSRGEYFFNTTMKLH